MRTIVGRATATVGGCPTSLCALARARVPRGCECALAFALAVRAGQEIGADADAVCGECGTLWSMAPRRQIWLRSWVGEPLCADCGVELELAAELRGFAELAAELTACFARPARAVSEFR